MMCKCITARKTKHKCLKKDLICPYQIGFDLNHVQSLLLWTDNLKIETIKEFLSNNHLYWGKCLRYKRDGRFDMVLVRLDDSAERHDVYFSELL